MTSDKETKERSPRGGRYQYISDLTIMYEGYGGEIQLRTPDISPQGMFVHTAQEFPIGAVILVKFRLSRTNFEVKARSEVRYVLPGVGIGLEFIEISPEARDAIKNELAIGSPIPSKDDGNAV